MYLAGYERKSLLVESALLETLCVRRLLALDESASVVNNWGGDDIYVMKAEE